MCNRVNVEMSRNNVLDKSESQRQDPDGPAYARPLTTPEVPAKHAQSMMPKPKLSG
jgi:hypothetical protein